MKKIVIPYRPRDFQKEVHDAVEAYRFSVIVAHRRFGKTIFAINHAIKQAVQCKRERPRYAYLAPLLGQAKTVAWDYLKHYTDPIPGMKRNESELWVEFPHNKARIRLFGADNPDALRGMYLDGAIPDEVAQMKPEVWGEIIRPALTDRSGWVVFIGTPKGRNVLFDLFQTARTTEGWFAGLYPVTKTNVFGKYIPEEELKLARQTMSESQYRQEFLCDFGASSHDALISLDMAIGATQKAYEENIYKKSPRVLGVDSARFGDDKSVIVLRQGLKILEIKRFQNMDTMSFAGQVNNAIHEVKPKVVFNDVVGIGAGVSDRLRQLGHGNIVDVNFGEKATDTEKYHNKRAECWCRVRDWLKNGGEIPDDTMLVSDLTTPCYDFDNKDRVRLESKKVIKSRGQSSPDSGDALAVTFAERVMSVKYHEQDLIPEHMGMM